MPRGRDVAAWGNHVYLLAENTGLVIVDVSDPPRPQRQGTLGFSDPLQLTVSGDHAYVVNGDGAGDLHVVDVSDPANPRRVGGYPHGHGFTLSGTFAYVSGGGAFEILDVSDPASPRRVGIVHDEDGDSTFSDHIFVSGGYAYLQSGLIVDVRDPATAAIVGRAGVHGEVISVAGARALNLGGEVVDVSDPAHPRWVANYSGRILDGHVSGYHAFVADGDGKLRVIDLNRVANPQRAGQYAGTGGSARRGEVFGSGPLACVADGANGIRLIDITRPSEPQLIGGYDTPGRAESVVLSGNLAYVADWDGGLQIIGVSNPAQPHFVAGLALPDITIPVFGLIPEVAERVVVSGNIACVTGYELHVIDVSNPAQPRRTGGARPPGGALDIFVSGPYAYVAGIGLHVYDLSDPAAPRRVGGYDTGSTEVRSVFVSRDHAYLAAAAPHSGGDSLLVLDVSDPAKPVRVALHTVRGSALSVFVAGNHAYVTRSLSGGSEFFSGLDVFEVSNPVEPRRVGGNAAFRSAFSELFVSGDNVFLATSDEGLLVFDLHRDLTALRLEPRVSQSPDTFRFRMYGPAGMSGRIQRSGDLRSWSDWQPFSLTTPSLDFLDQRDHAMPMRFYRAVSP
jgi:hypothetical protein